MPDVSALLVLVATAAVFVTGGAYYGVLGSRLATASGAPTAATPHWVLAVEMLRCLVLAAVVVGLAVQSRVDTWTEGIALATVLWVGFPFVLWVGAVVHEKTPWRVAVIHAGDWLVKLLVLGVLVGIWG